MAGSFEPVNNGTDALALHVQQILDVLMGASTGNIPVYLTALNDPAAPNLTLRHRDAAGKPLVIYAADGTTKLLEIQPSRPVVTGSRGGNAALASLLQALASLNLITDQTT